jgi:GNAT superfamily N-acetyltransferase
MPYDPLIEETIRKRRELKSTPRLVAEQFFDSTIGDKENPPGDDSIQEPLLSPLDVIPYERIASSIVKPAKSLLGNEIGTLGDWKKQGYKLVHDPKTENRGWIWAYDKDGKFAGHLSYLPDEDDASVLLPTVYVDPQHRRKGIGTAMYQMAEEKSGKTFIPHPDRYSESARALWNQPDRPFGKDPLQKQLDTAWAKAEKFSNLVKEKLGDNWHEVVKNSTDPQHQRIYKRFGELTNEYSDLLLKQKLNKPLDMSESARLGRASEMGFDTNKTWYHASPGAFKKFRPGDDNLIHFGTQDQANALASQKLGDKPTNIMPVYLKSQNPLEINDPGYFNLGRVSEELFQKGILTKEEMDSIRFDSLPEEQRQKLVNLLKGKGYDSFKYKNIYEVPKDGVTEKLAGEAREKALKDKVDYSVAVFEPSQVRSKWADFDPKKSGSGNISAGIGAAATAAAASGPEAEANMDFDWNQFEEEKPSTQTQGTQVFNWDQFEEEKPYGIKEAASDFGEATLEHLPEIGAGVGALATKSILGAGVGGFTGKAVQNAIRSFKEPEKAPQTNMEYLTQPAEEGLGAMTGQAVGEKFVAPLVGAVARNLPKKSLSLLGPSQEAIDARLAGRAQDSAKGYPALADQMAADARTLAKEAKQATGSAAGMLDTTANISRKAVTDYVDDAINSATAALRGVEIGPVEKSRLEFLKSLRQDFNKMRPQISQRQIHEVIKRLDENIDWNDQSRDALNRILKSIRTDLSANLKGGNAGYGINANLFYGKGMKEAHRRTQVLEALQKRFGLKQVPGEGLQATDATAGAIKKAPGELRQVSRRSLDALNKLSGNDYSDLANDYRLSQQFATRDVLGTAGARRSVAGLAGGLVAGSPLIGTAIGMSADIWGGRWAAFVLDNYAKHGPKMLQQFGAYAPAVQKAIERGPKAVGVLGAILGADPEFRKNFNFE